MKRRWRKAWLLSVPLLILLMGSIAVGVQYRQNRLDRALIQAVKELDTPAVDRLLAQGADANAKDTGEPPLTLVRLMKRLVAQMQHKPEGVSVKDANTPLLLLIIDDRLTEATNVSKCDTIAVALIRHGADIHIRGLWGEGPLSAAATCGLHQTLDLLIMRGADVNASDEGGRTPLMCADTYSAKMLLQHGADVASIDCLKRTALFYTDSIDTCRVLIDHGANVNAVDNEGLSLLYNVQHDANHPAVAQFLKQHGAHLNSKDRRVLAAHSKPVL